MSNSLTFNFGRSIQLYDSQFQTEGAMTLKAFDDNASVIRGTESNNDHNV